MSRMKVWLVVALALAVVAPALAEDDEEKKVRRIHVQKIMASADCDGEDCPESSSRVVSSSGTTATSGFSTATTTSGSPRRTSGSSRPTATTSS